MRHFGSVVGVDVIEMFYRRHHGSMSGVIAFECVGHQPSWFTALAFEETAKEAHGRFLVASPLHQDINRVAVLINRTPQILALPLNGDKDFVQIPGIT